MTNHDQTKHDEPPSGGDPGLRRMLTWVAIALIATLGLAILGVEITRRLFGG